MFVGDSAEFVDNLEAGSGCWSHRFVTPAFLDEWHLESSRAHSGAYSWKAGGPDTTDYDNGCDGGLVTPPFLLPADARLEFYHWIDAEAGQEPGEAWDGAFVEISNGDGVWTPVNPVFGYPYEIISNVAGPLNAGTQCFSGSQDWSQVQFDLSAYSGVVQLRFRFGSDGYTVGEGWYVDDISVSEYVGCCKGLRGNIDGSIVEDPDISDLVFLVDYMFTSGPVPPCLEEADLEVNGGVDISDLVYLVDYMFTGGPEPPPCP